MRRTCRTYRREEESMYNFEGEVSKNETKRKTECRWEDNMKIELREIGWVAWTGFISRRIRSW
jgi:hypothetical protein